MGEGRVTSPSARPETRQLGSGTTHLTRKCRGFPEMHKKIRKDQGKLISLYQVVPSGQKSEAANLELNKPNMGAEFLEFVNKPNMGANKPNMGAHSLKI